MLHKRKLVFVCVALLCLLPVALCEEEHVEHGTGSSEAPTSAPSTDAPASSTTPEPTEEEKKAAADAAAQAQEHATLDTPNVELNAKYAKSPHFNKSIHNPVFDMQALLGLHNVKELKDLPQETRWRRLKTLAESHDANKNGFIEPDELHAWIIQSYKLIDREEAHEKMAADDLNQDGVVTIEEIIKKQYGYSLDQVKDLEHVAQAEPGRDVLLLINADKKRFAVADKDGNGDLNDEEFQAYFQPYDYPHMIPAEMERVMLDLDKDKDGFVSPAEFIADGLEEEARLVEQSQFEDLDKDKDGKLTSDEVRPWAMTSNNDIAAEEVEHLMEACDDDKDKLLSIDEVVKAEEDFASSAVTDYGRMVHFVKDEL